MTSKKTDSKIKDSKLYSYLRNFTIEILNYFKENIVINTIPKRISKSYNPIFSYKENGHIRSFDEGEEELLENDYRVLVLEHIDYISNLESSSIIVKYLESKKISLNNRLNIILNEFIIKFLIQNNSFNFKLNVFNDVYNFLEKILFHIPNKIKTIAIIPSLHINESCFKINNEISIKTYNKDYFNLVYSNTKEKNYLSMMLLASNGKFSFIEITTSEIIQSDLLPFFMNPIDLISNLVLCLRLFNEGDICIINYVQKSDNLIACGGGTITIGNRIPFSSIHKQYTLNKSELEEFRVFYEKFKATLDRIPNYISLAISRYNDIWFRKKVEDIIVDLIIAFESLFLSNNPEMSFRLAFSVAHFIAKTTQERKEIYITLKDAYDVRSKVVHGSNSRSKSKIISKLPNIISKLQNYFRFVIKKIILERLYILNKNDFLKYIEDIILS